jgi:hydroxymethylpyrimidine pyrophosphatase-like HAD family hydrolase
MVSSAMHFARELGLDSPVIGYQGALIREMPATGSDRLGRLLVHTPMPAAVAREIVTWTREHGLDPHLKHLERLIVRTDDPRADEYGAFIGGDPELSGDLVESIRHPDHKILAAGSRRCRASWRHWPGSGSRERPR